MHSGTTLSPQNRVLSVEELTKLQEHAALLLLGMIFVHPCAPQLLHPT